MQRPNEGSFYRELKELDYRLDCYLDWDMKRERDLKDPLWVITFDSITLRRPVVLTVIHDGNLRYRYPNKNDIEFLKEWDTERISMKEQMEKSAAYVDKYRTDQERKAREAIRDMTKDDKYTLRTAMRKQLGETADAPHVRRVAPKSKGKTIEELKQ